MRNRNRFAEGVKIAVIGFALASMACTTDYVTGKRTFSLVSESQEIAMGKEADPQIVAEYGLYDNPELGQYVDRIGQTLAGKSQRSDLAYTFRVLDSPVVNAFALPGGYVYVTRGILAHFNSEDQLAGVIGHEIGHVVARHGAEQMSRQQLAGLGLGLGSILSDTFRKYAEVAGFGAQLLMLKYSRTQESESDLLGVEYSTKAGYDAAEMAAFFATLRRLGEEGGQSLPSFLSTHPDPGDRENRVRALAAEWQQKVAYQPLNKQPYEYLRRIDGLVYGDDPRQGYVEGGMFFHPALRFQFPIPANWQLVNSASTVWIVSPDEQAIIQLRLAEGDSPDKAADSFIARNELTVRERRAATVHGFAAVIVNSTGRSGEQQLGILSYFIKKDAGIYAFHGYSEASVFAKYSSAFSSTMGGFEEARDARVLDKKPRRLKVSQVPRSGTLSSVLEAMGAKRDVMKDIAVLNGLELADPVEKGRWIKIVGD
jgi:predicted Zn-dependent protease